MKPQRSIYFLAAAIGAGFLGGMASVRSLPPSHRPVFASSTEEAKSRDDISQGRALADQLSAVFEQASDRVSPSIVPVFSEQTVDVGSPGVPDPFRDFFGDDFFRRFFRVPGGPGGRQTVRGLGSGVIVSSDGYILTNNHVVQGARKLTVVVGDSKNRLDARIVGTDPQTDVAVIKVDSKGLPAAQLGNSDDLRVGQWVIAVGNPFQLMHTVTTGIISAKGRSSVGLAEYEDFIQTDASINPGNSGGALADLDGNVIGINTAISSPSGGNVGIGFAIPINMARTVMKTLIEKGKVSRGYLGLLLQDVDENLARALHLEKAEGVIVANVTVGGPAGEAGVKNGDVILTLNGKPVKDTVELRNSVAQTPPGTSVRLGIVRDGKKMDVTATLGEKPQEIEGSEERGRPQGEPAAGKIGLSVQTLTPELARQLGYRDEHGALVAEVEQGSPADDAGIQRGDLIVSVNRVPVSSAGELQKALRSARSGDALAFLVRRDGGTFYAAVTIP